MKKKIKLCLLICIFGLFLGGMAVIHFQPQIGYVMSEYVGRNCESVEFKQVKIRQMDRSRNGSIKER